MFGKILRAGKGGHGLKYKIDIQVTQLENLPTSIKKCRVVWARSAKVQITDVKDVRGSVASFKQTLTQVTTIYRDKSGKLEPKEYEFKVQVPGKSSSDATVTIGKAVHDMAKYCREETTTQNAMLPITFKVGGTTTGYLKMVVTTIFLGDANDDGLTEVSGMTGLTSNHGSIQEQDLEGFNDDDNAKFSKKSRSRRDDVGSLGAGSSGRSSSSSKPEGARRRRTLPPMAEEEASDLEEAAEPEPAPAKSSKKKSHHSRQAPEAEAEEEANPFARKIAKPPSKRVQPKVWEDDEDVSPLNSDMSDSEQAAPPKAKTSSRSKEPDESLDDMKASLFASKKTTSPSARGAAAAAASGTAAAAASSSSKATSGKAGKVSLPPPVEEEDDESLRNDLFSAKPKGAATSSKSVAGKAAGAAAAALGGAAAGVAAAAATSKHKSRSAPPLPPPEEEAAEDEYDDYGPSTSAAAAAPAVASKSRSKVADVSDAAVAKGSSGLARAGSSRAEPAKGGSSVELDQLRQRAAQLEKQLADEQVAKEDLNHKMQKYVDKIADLEDQLAEGDVTELFAQMKEMETKYQAEIKEMEAKYQAEIKELMERHLAETEELEERHRAELQEAQSVASSSRRGGDLVASAEELKRLQSELREQEALLKSLTAKLEAEQAAANTARQSAETKLAEANKMIDDSLLVATRHQQENKALQEEVARLKRRLEDTSMWDTNAAVAAATSAAAASAAATNGRRSSEDEEELEELREKLQELQEENARLQKLNEVAQHTAADMLHDIHALLQDVRGADGISVNTGSSQLGQLAVALRCLCDAYSQQSAELRGMEARLSELSQRAADSNRGSMSGDPLSAEGLPGGTGSAKVKPHELLSRVQQLTAERDALQEQLAGQRQARTDLAAAQRQIADLQQQVDKLAAEKEAVERFKFATIADLRRQNDELRTSLRSLSSTGASPVATYDEDALAGSNPNTPGDARAALAGSAAARQAAAAGDGQGNWHEFESLVTQLKADRVELRRQVDQLKAEKALLGKQVQDLRSTGGAAAAAGLFADPADMRLQTPRQQSERYRAEQEWEQERVQLQSEIARLQAQVAEFSEADAVIKEWSDYADGLMADKTRLEEQVQQLTQQLAAGASVSDRAIVAAAERRAEDWQRRAMDAQKRIEEFQRAAADWERRALDAEGRLQELQLLAEEAGLRAQDAERRAEEATSRLLGAERRAEDAERRVSIAERSARDAECKAEDFEQRAWTAERRAKEAEVKAEEAAAAGVASVATTGAAMGASPRWPGQQQQHSQPADTGEVMELRREISRLEASLSGLRVQLMETQSRSGSARDEVASSSRTRHRDLTAGGKDRTSYGGRHWMEDDARSSAGGSSSSNESAPERGWHAELEELRNRNASLEATVAGLQASLAAASHEADVSGASGLPRSSRRAERQLQELQSQMAAALKEKAELESTVASLRSQLERAPHARDPVGEDRALAQVDLVGGQPHARNGSLRAAGVGTAAALVDDVEMAELREQCKKLETELARIQKERASLAATVDDLRSEVERLQEEKGDAEAAVHRLSSEMEELAEALDASNNENERLSLEVLNLRDQVDQLEGGGEGVATRSQSARSARSTRGPSSQGSEADESVEGHRGQLQSRAAERELAAARAAARELILQVAAGGNAGGGLGDDEDLAQALKSLRSQIAELQKQSRMQQQQQAPTSCTTSSATAAAIAAAEAQLARATARIDELEQLLENAEIENQHLTEQLEEFYTTGRKGPDSVGSVAEECQSSYGGSAAGAATSNPYSYGHANTLALSAFEQRLAMAEGRRDELAAALEDANATIRRLEADVAASRQQLAAVRRGQDSGALDDVLERSFSQVPARSRGSRSASDSEENWKKRIEDLQAGNRKLEAVCHDLEDKANDAQERAEKLQADLEDAQARARELEATLKRLEEEGGPAGGRQKVSDLEARAARLAREKASLEEQLEEERAVRQELEETLKDKLDRDGDDEAAETVAAFEVKYNRLKERYKMLEESSQEEIDELQDQLTDALSQVADLQRQIKQLQTQVAQNRNGSAVAGGASLDEIRNLRAENERFVQQLVAKTMELAELSEREITIKRELTRLHEVNMKLAQKATTLEAQAALAEAAAAKPGKGGKK